ncbi:unnamed protein product [Paramecium sonneborni]|uniref:Uncharacterized protein n=1 Tax=Paramecium sonneborni TaxID=65129 RepID=A0A8S1QHA7_9CILI|nr:unnamed protein product [Paramecium sonneborni]
MELIIHHNLTVEDQQYLLFFRGVQEAIQQINKINKVIAITDSNSTARIQVVAFFKTRAIDDFNVLIVTGDAFDLQNNQVRQSSLKYKPFIQLIIFVKSVSYLLQIKILDLLLFYFIEFQNLCQYQ